MESVMKLFDRILGRRHASANWQLDPGLEVRLDLDAHAICRCTIGDPIEWFSGLGPPEDKRSLKEQRYCYYSKGIEIGEEDDKVADFAVFWTDYLLAGFEPFKGPIIYRGKSVVLNSASTENELVNLFGDPYWKDRDEEEIILFYEFRGDIEWQVECTLEGKLKALRVVWPAVMSLADQRALYRVSREWPPPRT
jgi:hypothetical protein